jgi:hypothetical protein
MPRKATDQVIEHRVTLGDYERTQLKSAVRAEAIKDYGQAMQGAGLLVLGGGAVLAATSLTMFLAPQLWGMIKEFPKNLFNDLVETATPVLDDTVDTIAKGSPIEHRRMAQEFAQRRAELSRNISVFCTASSKHYSEKTCTKLNTQDKRQYFADLKAFNDMIDATYNDSSPTHMFSMKKFIYQGLGDIDPTQR